MNVWVVPADMRALYQAEYAISFLRAQIDACVVEASRFSLRGFYNEPLPVYRQIREEPPIGKQH